MTPRRIRLAAFGLFFLLWPEAANYLASRSGDVLQAHERCQVLVLGYPGNDDGTPSPVQLYRVRSGIFFFRKYSCSSLIFSGGNPHSTSVEAEMMSRIAVQGGFDPGKIVLDSLATNTWENVRNCLPHVAKSEHVFIVSDAMHALRAKTYLCRQSPEICPRAHVAVQYEPLRLSLYKWFSAYYTLIRFL